MTTVGLRILQPASGAGIVGAAPLRLRGEVISGSPAGLFFTWYSTWNTSASAAHPELNVADHSAAALDWTTAPPQGVGSHVLTLAAADCDGSDLDSVRAVTRAGFTGGAPGGDNPAPCVVHQVLAVLRTPGADDQSLSKASATIEFRGPARWARQDPPKTGPYVPDADYHAVHGLRFRLRLAPESPDAARTAEWTPPAAALTYFVADDLPWLRWRGELPANLGTGKYQLTLFCETLDDAVRHSVARKVNLVA